MKIKVGCCGFPQAKKKYFNQFGVVEIQQTFYSLPKLETAEKWRVEAPLNFEFTIKAWQLITHEPTSPTYRKAKIEIGRTKVKNYGSFRPTEEVFEAWGKTKEIAQYLRASLVVFQSPASFAPTIENKRNLRTFFKKIERENLILAWEPRGKWKEAEIEDLCQELNLVDCVDPFKRKQVYGNLAYYRLHGKTGYRYRYTDEDLVNLLKMCKEYPLIYCMFNNITMWEDARRFLNIVTRGHS